MSPIFPVKIDFVAHELSLFLCCGTRISAFFLVAPFFSQAAIPRMVKIMLTIGIALTVMNAMPHAVPFSQYNTLTMITVSLKEMVIGLAMGLIIKIIFEVLSIAGQMVSTAMQLNFATAYSLNDGSQTNELASFYEIFGMLMFITLHGPVILITLLYKSYETMPIGFSINNAQILYLMHFSRYMFIYGLLLSLPVVITLMIVNSAMAVVSRLSSMLNVFSIGFSVSVIMGLSTLMVSLPFSLMYFSHIIEMGLKFLSTWQVIR